MKRKIGSKTFITIWPKIVITFVAAIMVGCGGSLTTTKASSSTPASTILPAITSNPGWGATGKIRFGFGLGNDAAASVAIQSDGKIVLAGGSVPLLPEHNLGAISRLNQNGTLDLTFGEYGNAPVPLDTVSAMRIDASGRIIIAGGALGFAAVRLNSNGSLDSSFGNGGKAVIAIGSGASSLAIQTDGKIVLAGQGTVGTVSGFVAARLNSDGSMDQSFGSAGIVAVAMNGGGSQGVAIDASGRIVMSGNALVGSSDNFAFVRLTGNGMPDTAFGNNSNGIVTIPISGGNGHANAVAVDSFGRIVAAGYASTTSWDFATIRLSDNGTLDSNFGNGGISVVPGWGISMFNAIAIDGNGKVMLAGTQNLNSTYSGSMPILVRLNGDGSTDNGFGSGGKSALAQVASGYNAAEATAVALDAAGRPVVAGHDGWNSDFATWRTNYDGTTDTSFGHGGEALVDVGNEQSQARALTQLANDKFLVAGFTSESGRFAIAKLNADGTFDPTFGTYGKTAFTLGTSKAYAYGMKVLSSGQILLVGQSGSGLSGAFGVARVNVDGTVDSSFGSGGYSIISIGGYDRAYAVAEDSAGGLLVAGFTTYSGNLCTCGTSIAVVRLDANGLLDTSFGTNGKVVIPLQGDYFGENSMVINSSGKIIVSGSNYVTGTMGVARLNLDGTFDTTFSSNGLLPILGSGSSDHTYTVQTDANDNMLIAGTAGIVHLNPDGTPDTNFGINGIVPLSLGGYWNPLNFDIDPQGRIIVFGSSSTKDFAVARFLSTGSPDTTFGSNGTFTIPIGENDDFAFATTIQPDGKIVLAGNGSYSFGLARIDNSP